MKVRSTRPPFGIAGLTAYVKPNDNGVIERESELYRFLEGISDKDQLIRILTDIYNKFPAEASETNKLADKQYVNDAISTAAADFKGTFMTMADMQAVTGNKNDYAYLISTDTKGNTVYNRYKWIEGSGWAFEYALKQDNFTDEEWSAIQSGITQQLVAKLSDLPTAEALADALAAIVGTNEDTKDDDTVYGAKAYAEYLVALRRTETILIGAAAEGEELTTTPQVISQLQETLVELSMFDDYIYILFPKTRDIVATMSSVDIPFTKIGEETIEGVVHSVLKSNNTYTGELKVALLLKY